MYGDKRTILFDLDGTLTDPGEGITASVAYALKKMGRPVPERQALYRFIGPPLVDSFQEFSGMDPEQALEATVWFREYFTARGIFENQVYPGVEGMLRRLQEAGRRLIVATSKPEPFAVKILRHFDLARYFDAIAGSPMDETKSQKWRVIARVLAAYDTVPKKEMIMVGDRKHDVEGAHQNGLRAIGVLYGYGDREELTRAGADGLAATVEELQQLLEGTV